MRFSRTRLTDAVHRLAFGVTRQARRGLGAATIPSRPISPRWFGERKNTTERPKARDFLCRWLITSTMRISMYPLILSKCLAELP